MMANGLMQIADLAYVRAEAKQALPTTVHLLELRRTEDQQGGYTEAYVLAYRDVPARLAEMSGKELEQSSRLDVDASYMLTVAWDQAIDAAMRVQHGETVYAVAFVNAGRSYDTARRAMLKRLD